MRRYSVAIETRPRKSFNHWSTFRIYILHIYANCSQLEIIVGMYTNKSQIQDYLDSNILTSRFQIVYNIQTLNPNLRNTARSSITPRLSWRAFDIDIGISRQFSNHYTWKNTYYGGVFLTNLVCFNFMFFLEMRILLLSRTPGNTSIITVIERHSPRGQT